MFIVFFVLAALCLVYYFSLVSYSGTGTPFSEAWIYATIACVLCGVCLVIPVVRDFLFRLPKWIKVSFFSVIGAGVLLFVVLLVNVLTGFDDYPDDDTDCVIVLGAKIRGENVTRALADRLDAAYDYATKEGNEDVVIIVSGGQGDDEVTTEAKVMKQYLVDKGMDEERVLMEDKSVNTKQNLKFSYEIIKENIGEDAKIAICTSNFHVYRATLLAKNMGLENVCGIAADTKAILVPNSTVRECFALVKEWLIGNVKL